MTNLKIKKWPLRFSIGVAIIFLFFISRDSLARFFWQKYRWPQAAILLNKNDVNLAMFVGNYYFNGAIGGGEYNLDIAERAYKKAVSINPKILWGHYQLARIYFVKGNYSLALGEIAKEFEANPENLRSLYIRGLIYGYRNQAGDLTRAEMDFRQFTKWAPSEWAGYNDLSWILSKAGEHVEAKAVIEDAFDKVAGAENNPWLWNSLGVAQLNLKTYSSAANSFKKAKELAEKLTPEEWRHSYPGNNPAASGEGLSAFIEAIDENFRRAESQK